MEVAEVSRTKFDPYVIGNNIRDLRGKRKMTQMKAAEEMDMSLCHYARIEEGSKTGIIKASEEKALIWDQTYWELFSLYLAYFTDLNAIQKTKSFCTMCVRRQRY